MISILYSALSAEEASNKGGYSQAWAWYSAERTDVVLTAEKNGMSFGITMKNGSKIRRTNEPLQNPSLASAF